MSAVDAPTIPHATATPAARAWRIVRLLTANPATTVGWPLGILTLIFVMNWTVWWLLTRAVGPIGDGETPDGVRFNGAVSFIFVYMLVVAVQAANQSFPLALGYGSTRRAFSAGSALAFTLLSLGYATLLTIGAWFEELTSGWGLHGNFFRTIYFATDAGWPAQWWIYFCWFVFFFFTGTIFAAVFVRWRATGLSTAFALLGLLVVGLLAALILSDGWAALGETLAALGPLGVASVALVPGVLAAVIGHLLLRRATPRS